MAQLAKLFLHHNIPVTIVVPCPQQTTTGSDAQLLASSDAITRVVAANPTVSFHLLPPVSNPNPSTNTFVNLLDTIRLAAARLHNFLLSLPCTPAALILDHFCVDALDSAKELNIPAYFYYTSAASVLAVLLQLPRLDSTLSSSFKDMGKTVLDLPGVPATIRACDMPGIFMDRESVSYKKRVWNYSRMPEAKGILINSFEWLEVKTVTALRDGVCIPGRVMPPLYCVGPLVAEAGEKGAGRHECLDWLDAQPKQSVVFLCFGSMGSFFAEQYKEIATGLESSGHRFLWVVRSPPDGPLKFFASRSEPDFNALLPEGFLERTTKEDRGMVVKSWAPQAEVLRHEAVGLFVTHCGWNSVLEAIAAAVPMVCWPLYAEQKLNKVFVVDEMKMGVEMKGCDEEEVVKAEEVEAKVRLVLESDEGRVMRERLVAGKEKAAEAVREGGPSRIAFLQFLMHVENRISGEQ